MPLQRLLHISLCVLALAGCRPPETAPPAPPVVAHDWFEDVTAARGINFVHHAGTNWFSSEQMGSGCALFDYDNDGRLDVYLMQAGGTNSPFKNQLLHQEPDGRFKDVSAGSGLDIAGEGMGVAVGDINDDGRPDLLVTEYGRARLFLNQGGGKFLEVTAASGIDNPRWGMSAAFFDFDRDGWLDLVIANYLDHDPSEKCHDAVGVLEFCGPHGFPGLAPRLFRNLGARSGAGTVRFQDVTVESGLGAAPGPGLGVLCTDFDGDGWPDIFISDDGKPNRLFLNLRNGTFQERAASSGVAFNGMGQTGGNMGIAIGDVNGDGLFDFFVTRLSEERHCLWVQGPRGFFEEKSAGLGLNKQGWRGTGFGAVMADFDNDGAIDLAFVNGLVRRGRDAAPAGSEVEPFWRPYAQRNQLFANDGRGNFRDVSPQNPVFCGRAAVGRVVVSGDLDNDGAVDLVVSSVGSSVKLLRNVGGKSGHWLMVRAVDPALGGRDAYGAQIFLRAGGRTFWREINPGSTYLGSNDPRAHFGLGPIEAFASLEVQWPDGTRESFPGGNSNQLLVLSKGRKN